MEEPSLIGEGKYLTKLKWSALYIAGAGLMLALASISPAYATDSPISGTFAFTASTTSVVTSDGNTIISFTFSETFTGSLVGTQTGTGTLIIHPDGTSNASGCGTFAGTILGISGTALRCFSTEGAAGSFTGEFQLTDGTGGLAGGHGEGTVAGVVTGPGTTAGTYSGVFEFGQ